MKSLKNVSKAGWLIAGILVAAVIAPSAAIATSAGADPAGGLRRPARRGDERRPADHHRSRAHELRGPAVLRRRSRVPRPREPAVFSSSAGLIVKELVVDAYDVSGPSTVRPLRCSWPGCAQERDRADQPRGQGDTVIPLSTGLVVPKKGMISFEVFHIGALEPGFGFQDKVPSKDAPHYSGTNHANIAS